MFTTENTESTESFSSLLCALCVLCGEPEPLNRTLIPQEMARSQPDEPGDFHGRVAETQRRRGFRGFGGPLGEEFTSSKFDGGRAQRRFTRRINPPSFSVIKTLPARSMVTARGSAIFGPGAL